MDGEIAVGAGEAVRFAPGEFQSGRNGGDGDLVALAMGAPRDSEDVRIPLPCPECGHDDMRLGAGEDGPELVCPDCDARRVPQGCPKCGYDDLHVALGEGTRTVVVCPDCGAEFEEPPFRD
jgi:transcription elongation factor Elf1